MDKKELLDDAIKEIERVLIGNKSKDVEKVYLRNAIRFIKQTEPEITEEQAWEVIAGYNGMTAKEANQMFADGMVESKWYDSIKRDDVIDRLQEIGEHNRNEWIEVVLRKFGNDYGTVKYQAGYEQGYLNGILKSKEDELVEIPQFVADHIKYFKEEMLTLGDALDTHYEDDREMHEWLYKDIDARNDEVFARAWLYGYEVEKKPQWIVYYVNDKDKCFVDFKGINGIEYGNRDKAIKFEDKKKANAVALLTGGKVGEH